MIKFILPPHSHCTLRYKIVYYTLVLATMVELPKPLYVMGGDLKLDQPYTTHYIYRQTRLVSPPPTLFRIQISK